MLPSDHCGLGGARVDDHSETIGWSRHSVKWPPLANLTGCDFDQELRVLAPGALRRPP